MIHLSARKFVRHSLFICKFSIMFVLFAVHVHLYCRCNCIHFSALGPLRKQFWLIKDILSSGSINNKNIKLSYN